MEDQSANTMNKSGVLGKSVSRRQVLRAGGFAAIGLVFLPPRINTIQPLSVGEIVSPIGPSPTATQFSSVPCSALIDTEESTINGPGITGNAVRSGTTNAYDLNLSYDCGACIDGTCVPSITYQWSAVSTTALYAQMANVNSASANVTPTLNLGTAGFGLAQFELQVAVTLVCGSGACHDTIQATLSALINVFA